MGKLSIHGHTYDLPPVPDHFINIDSADKFEFFRNDILSPDHPIIAFDTETSGLSRTAEVFVVSFTTSKDGTNAPGYSYYYRFHMLDTSIDESMLDIIEELFNRQTGPPLVIHNAAYDLRLIRQTFNIEFTSPLIHDTMLMAQIPQKFVSAGLKYLGQELLKHTDRWDYLVKDYLDNMNVTKKLQQETRQSHYEFIPDQIMFPYAATDTELVYKLYFELLKFYEKKSHLRYIYRMERQVVLATSEIEYNGQYIDLEYLKSIELEVKELLALHLKEFRERWGATFNPRSIPQLRAALFGQDKTKGQLGLPVLLTTESGTPSTSADAIEEHVESHPFVDKLATYIKLSTLLNNFILKLQELSIPQDDGNTIHTSYFQILKTGRFSSQAPNLQNMPNDNFGKYSSILPSGKDLSLRRAFICPKDTLYVKLDYSAFELRLIGNASKDPIFVEMIGDGLDMHSWLAKELYRVELNTELERGDFDEWIETWEAKANDPIAKKWHLDWAYYAINSKKTTELKYRRNMVKLASFAIVYGAKARRIKKIHNLRTEREAQELMTLYFESFKRVFEWRQEVELQAYKYQCCYTMFGRVRNLTLDEYVPTTAVNTVIQGTAADIMKLAMIDIYQILRTTKSKLRATIHDEIQLTLHYDELELILPIIAAMEKSHLPEDKFPLPMLCEISASNTNWADCKELNKTNIIAELEALRK